jgi:DNA-binding MarR family transcriptional regulator
VSTTSAAEQTVRPIHRVAREMSDRSGFLLAQLGFGFKAKALARAEEEGFELYDYGILALLAEGDCQTQATIAEAVAVDPSRLVAVLDSLERRELVVRSRAAHDRRRHVVRLTPAGARELVRIRDLAKEVEEEFLAPLDAESRTAFHGLLLSLAAHTDPRCCPFEDDDSALVSV